MNKHECMFYYIYISRETMFQPCLRQVKQKPCMNYTKMTQMPFSSLMAQSSSLAPKGLKRMRSSMRLDWHITQRCGSTGHLQAWVRSLFSAQACFLDKFHTPRFFEREMRQSNPLMSSFRKSRRKELSKGNCGSLQLQEEQFLGSN